MADLNTGRPALEKQLKADEGFRPKPYRCTAGKLTIGYGRNLEGRGINETEAAAMLGRDIRETEKELQVYAWFRAAPPARQDAFINMAFQLGMDGFRGFKKTIAAAQKGDWEACAAGMLDSKWAAQTPARAKRAADLVRKGVYP